MNRRAILFLMSLVPFLMVSCNSQDEGGITNIDKATVKAKVIGKEVQWLDVRTPQEYNDGHIDDAMNFDINGASFMEQINTLDKNKPVYLYCQMGGRSTRAAEILKQEGFKEIYNYKGGYTDWSSED
ncbi:rhodanese-like domain-containing protein [Muricauda sp. JGD-17]|uniref:Rhodanese-like domain-containing protein n=1 Tax=Flagellimonas ochracea TaxID=2696472 RepID=A0A964WX99_9FLAO|nr:rhodanese-like domain-containing protein [Allomuricauda ochracea]NAY91374.1 rhodanese-like domain-containing protein [Allomuricauda ochracea]